MDMSKMEALEGLVTEVDTQGGPTPEQQAEQQQQQTIEDGAREWGAIMYMVGGGRAMLAPERKAVYTEDRCLAWGQTVMPVAEKYGWDQPGSIPELGLVISTLGFAVPSVMIIRHKLATIKAAKQEEEQAAKPVDPLADVDARAAVVPDGG
jgi:hypothetical protein